MKQFPVIIWSNNVLLADMNFDDKDSALAFCEESVKRLESWSDVYTADLYKFEGRNYESLKHWSSTINQKK